MGKSFNLLALMTSAPRRNTHALIALGGPVQVQHTVIHAATAAKSVQAWTIGVHAEPAWRAIELPAGTYRLALRYYRWSASAELPAVEIDGVPALPPLADPADVNDFYQDLAGRSTAIAPAFPFCGTC